MLRHFLLLSLLLCFATQISRAEKPEELKTWVIVHTNIPSVVKDTDGRVLGRSGKAIDLRYSGEEVPEVLGLVLAAEGCKELLVEASLDELTRTHRLPAQGVYSLVAVSRSNYLPLTVVLVALSGLVVLVLKRNKAAEDLSHQEPYQLGEQIGEGSSASVYRGSCGLVGQEPVAIKLLNPEYANDEELLQRYERESELALTLQHPNIVRVFHSAKTADGRPFLVMELLDGETLESLLEQQSKLEGDWVPSILLAVCDALIYLHDQNIVHRDIKPGNIFLTKDGGVKLLDLGIARAEHSVDITQTGRTLGTPSYMAPEQILGKTSPQTDQYAVGVMMFELLSGCKPFEDGDVLQKHLREAAPSLASLEPTVTSFQELVVTRLLEKRPEARFGDMREARESIDSCLSSCDDGTMTC